MRKDHQRDSDDYMMSLGCKGNNSEHANKSHQMSSDSKDRQKYHPTHDFGGFPTKRVSVSPPLFVSQEKRSNTTSLLLYFQRQRYPVSVVVFVSHAIASCSMISSSLWTVVIIDVNHPLFYRQTQTEGHSNVRLEGNHKNS